MFGYVSVAQLSVDIRLGLHRIPRDVDLIVGIPRSGMLPAYLIGLYVNRLVADLETFVSDGAAGSGNTRPRGVDVSRLLAAKHVLLVDDSLSSGGSMRAALKRIGESGFGGRITTCSAIVTPEARSSVDIFFREIPHPRLFEWNAFHHATVANACFDLDGVLCVDPAERDNDDGSRYLDFVSNATPLFRPTQRIGHIVSARLERYREPTESWLARQGITYGALHLVDLPTQAERIRLRAHASHKVEVYRRTGASLFYESDREQAREIADQSGKPVLCVADMDMYLPGTIRVSSRLEHAKWQLKVPMGRLKGWLKRRLLERRISS